MERRERLGDPSKRGSRVRSVVEVGALDPTPPAGLGEHGSQMWERVVSCAPWLTAADAVLLEMTCAQVDRRASFVALIERDGPVAHSRNGHPIQHPLVGATNALERAIGGNLGLLGLTAVDRARLGVSTLKAEKTALQVMRERRQRDAGDG